MKIIEIKKEIKIGDIILEPGDKIRLLGESTESSQILAWFVITFPPELRGGPATGSTGFSSSNIARPG